MISAALLFNALLILLSPLPVRSFDHVPGSPCTDICSGNPQNTLQNDVVCLDSDYSNSTDGGEALRKCVACELNSTAVDTGNNRSDVEWGLFNLRYTLSECFYSIPEARISISNPCVVTCAPLSEAISYHLSNDSSTDDPSLAFCNAAQFDDTTINNCAFCYGLIPQQLYLANMLQALHVACRVPPQAGSAFYPDGETIFNNAQIAGPTPASNTPQPSGGLHGWRLALAIALPVVGGILILCGACWCCFVYTRRKRRRMAETGRMSRLRDSWTDAATYMDGPAAYQPEMTAVHEQEMTPITPQWMQSEHPKSSPGMAGSPALPTEAVGPGEGQIQDPNLHERYLGTPTRQGPDEIGVAQSNSGLGLQQSQHSPETFHTPPITQNKNFYDQVVAGPSGTNNHEERQQDERGQWVE